MRRTRWQSREPGSSPTGLRARQRSRPLRRTSATRSTLPRSTQDRRPGRYHPSFIPRRCRETLKRMQRQVLMPALSPSMTDGRIARWHVSEGQSVAAGDILAEIVTATATLELEAKNEGRVEKILVPAGTEVVKINTPIALIQAEGAGPEHTPPQSDEAPSTRKSRPARLPARPVAEVRACSAAGRRCAASLLSRGVARCACRGDAPRSRRVFDRRRRRAKPWCPESDAGPSRRVRPVTRRFHARARGVLHWPCHRRRAVGAAAGGRVRILVRCARSLPGNRHGGRPDTLFVGRHSHRSDRVSRT